MAAEEQLLDDPETQYPQLIDMVMRGEIPALARSDLAEPFGPYSEPIARISHEASAKPIAELVRLDGPVVANLLHHIRELPDLLITRRVEVPYDSDHPTGEDTVKQEFSRDKQRELAHRTLANLGDPDYDSSVYLRRDCWTKPTSD